MAEKYLLDSNIFITPHRLYYPFDFAEGFWNQLEEKLKLDSVTVLDVVVAEVSKLEDELSSWLENLEDFETLSVRSPAIVTNYGKVLSYVQHCGLYREEALRNWARGDIADPWLIAAAMDTGAVIITVEQTAGTGLSAHNPSRNAKLPDVAAHFNIKCENLFYFMRQMNFKL